MDVDQRLHLGCGQCSTSVAFQKASPTVITAADNPINFSSCLHDVTSNVEVKKREVIFYKDQFSEISDLLALTDELRDALKPPCLHQNCNHGN